MTTFIVVCGLGATKYFKKLKCSSIAIVICLSTMVKTQPFLFHFLFRFSTSEKGPPQTKSVPCRGCVSNEGQG